VRCFPPPCPSKPATARLAASLARPVTAPAPPPRLDGPPRPAEARRGVTARQGAPKPATGRGRPLAPAVRPPPPPSPPAVAARPRGAPAVRLPLARRRPPWRADHRRPPPSGAPQPRPPPARKHDRKKLVKNPYCKFFALRKPCKNPFLQLVFITGFGRFLGYGPKSPNRKKTFFWTRALVFLRRLADHNLRKFPPGNISRHSWRFIMECSRSVIHRLTNARLVGMMFLRSFLTNLKRQVWLV